MVTEEQQPPLEQNQDISKLSQQLDVVVEHIDHVTSDSIITGSVKTKMQGVSCQQVDRITNDVRSDILSENVGKEGQSVAGFDMMSSLRNTQVTGLDPSVLSKGSKVKRQILNLLKQLMERIKEEQEESNPECTSANTGVQQAEVNAPETVPSTSFYMPNQQLENFLLEKLSQ